MRNGCACDESEDRDRGIAVAFARQNELTQRTAAEQGRDLTGILIAAFLILMLLEMGVARYVG